MKLRSYSTYATDTVQTRVWSHACHSLSLDSKRGSHVWHIWVSACTVKSCWNVVTSPTDRLANPSRNGSTVCSTRGCEMCSLIQQICTVARGLEGSSWEYDNVWLCWSYEAEQDDWNFGHEKACESLNCYCNDSNAVQIAGHQLI